MAKQRSRYFWQVVDERLQRGDSITRIATEFNSTFNEIWGRFRSNPQLPRKERIHIWLDREEDRDATARLEKLWPQIEKYYTAKQSISKPTPSTLAIRWGIKSPLIARKLRAVGLLECLTIRDALATRETIEYIIKELLEI